MRVVVMNPNTTASMTAAIAEAARRRARPDTEIVPLNPLWGPPSIEGWYEGFLSAAAVLERLADLPADVDALVMAGFGEPGREGARQLLDIPVLDITEAAAQFACVLGERYAVVTTLASSVSQVQLSLTSAGLMSRCAAILATGLGVLELEADPAATRERIAQRATEALQAGADVICLGCGGMAGFDEELSTSLGVPVVDGVVAAVKQAEALVDCGLSTSKHGAFAPPNAKAAARRSA